jgi:hypothetical protein
MGTDGAAARISRPGPTSVTADTCQTCQIAFRTAVRPGPQASLGWFSDSLCNGWPRR